MLSKFAFVCEYCFSLSGMKDPYPITITCCKSEDAKCQIGCMCCELSCRNPEHVGPTSCYHSDSKYCCFLQNTGFLCNDIPHMCVICCFMVSPECGCLQTTTSAEKKNPFSFI